MLELLRYRFLGWWARLMARYYVVVLIAAALTTTAAIAVTALRLEFHSDRNALLSPDLPWNKRFEDWRASFPGNEDLYVVIDTGNVTGPDRQDRLADARSLVSELGPALASDEHILYAVWEFDPDHFSPRALRLEPIEQFTEHLNQMAQAKPMLESSTIGHLLDTISKSFQGSPPQPTGSEITDSVKSLAHLIDSIARVMDQPPTARPHLAVMMDDPSAEHSKPIYLSTENGRLLFIRVTPRKATDTINALGPAIETIRQLIAEYSQRYPQIEVGLTGIDVIEADETDAANRDSTIASIVASILITVLLIAGFHSWRPPFLAMAALLVGIAWSFGYLTLIVGHLQVLSVVFAVMLLGLGIAYGIHLASRLELTRRQFPDGPDGFSLALQDTLKVMGPGIFTGAITTAAAFCTTVFTDFRGVAEMGLISGGGIMLCLLAMFTVYPALLRLLACAHRHVAPTGRRVLQLFHESWIKPFERWPRLTLVLGCLITLASLFAASRLHFDYDLLKLQPRGVDSVEWQQRVMDDGDESVWVGVDVVDSLEQARIRKAQLLSRPTVAKVNGIGILFPDDEEQKIQQLNATRELLGDSLNTALASPIPSSTTLSAADFLTQLQNLQRMVTSGRWLLTAERTVSQGLTSLWPFGQHDPQTQQLILALDELGQRLTTTIQSIRSLDPQQRQSRLDQLNQEYAQWRLQTAQRVSTALDPSPLTPQDLPEELLRPYIASHGPLQGKFALEVHAKLPDDPSITQPLDPRFLPKFIKDLEAPTNQNSSPYVTGVIMQVYRSGDLIKTSYRNAGIYALVVVFLLVWLDFYSLRDTLLSLVPVVVGFAVTFGIMWLLGMAINPANIIVLPLMFGIGVDSGVHMLHRYRQNPDLQPLGLASGTGKAITITSYTTMIGFGAMMMAHHRGIANLGFVLTTGIGLTLLACWTVMPALLQICNLPKDHPRPSFPAESSRA